MSFLNISTFITLILIRFPLVGIFNYILRKGVIRCISLLQKASRMKNIENKSPEGENTLLYISNSNLVPPTLKSPNLPMQSSTQLQDRAFHIELLSLLEIIHHEHILQIAKGAYSRTKTVFLHYIWVYMTFHACINHAIPGSFFILCKNTDLVFEPTTHGKRMLEVQNPNFDIVDVIASLQMRQSEEERLVIAADGRTAYVNSFNKIKSINILDTNQLSLVEYSPDTDFFSNNYMLSPNGERIFSFEFRVITIYNNIPGPQSKIVINSGDQPPYSTQFPHTVIFPDGRRGMFSSSTELYYFDVDTPTYFKVKTFLGKEELIYLQLSADGSTAFVAQSNTIHILNVSNPELPILVNSKSYDGVICSITVSPDAETLYILRNNWNPEQSQPHNPSYLDIFNISDLKSFQKLGSTSINDTNEATRFYCDKNMVLIPEASTLIIPGLPSLRMVDVSNPTSLEVFTSKLPANKYGIAQSPNNSIFMITGREFMAINPLINIKFEDKIEHLFSFDGTLVTMDNLTNYIAATTDGKQAIFAYNDTVDIYQVSDQGSLSFLNSVRTDTPVAFVSLSPDNKYAYLISKLNDLIILDTAKDLLSRPKLYIVEPSVLHRDQLFTILPDGKTSIFWTEVDAQLGGYAVSICKN